MSENQQAAHDDARIATIKTAMALPNTDPKSYWADLPMREEYSRLIAARDATPPGR